MSMKKYKIICCLFAAIFMVLPFSACQGKEKQPEGPVFMEEIQRSPCAKFEYRDSETDGIFVTGEIFGLTSYFPSVILEESGEAVTDWIYRITFNCKEIYAGDDEIVVLIGENGLSINGTACTTPVGTPFSSVVDAIAAKYQYMGGT